MSNLTAKVPFSIDDGPNGNEFYGVVKGSLLPGTYDLVIKVYVSLPQMDNFCIWFWIRVEGEVNRIITHDTHTL